jgi:PHP family Zn ribbon phosphoesterase
MNGKIKKSVKRMAESTPQVKIIRCNLSKKIQELDILFSPYF